MNSLASLVDRTLVSHAPFQAAVREIETCFEFAVEASEPICVALIGPARTGKSRVLDVCERQHPKVRREDGMYVPILRVTTPSKPTVKGLAEILLEMGAVDTTRGTENERTRRVKYLMRNTGTRMLMIDEFQHFFDKGTKLIMHHVADWLKILVDETRCALVVAGLPSCQTVIDSNEQTAGRFDVPILMPRFSWQDMEQREEFIGILQAFHQVLSQHFQTPEFQREAMAFRFYCATGGLIGYLTKILRRSLWQVVAADRKEITLEDLCDAHEKAVWCGRFPQRLPKPFARSLFQHDRFDHLQPDRRRSNHD